MKKEMHLLGFLLLSAFIVFGCSAPVSEIPEEAQNQVEQPEVIKEPVIEQVAGEASETIEKDIVEPQPKPEVKTQEVAAEQSPKSALSPCEPTPLVRQFSNTPYYTGPLFDAHFHVPDLSEVSLNNLLCIFDKEKVKGTILFYWNAQLSLEKRLAEAESIKNDSSGKIRVFLAPVQYSLKALEDIEAAHEGLFTGYGEMAFITVAIPARVITPNALTSKSFLIYMLWPEKIILLS